MKKQTLIIIILCVLVAAAITLSVLGVIGPQDSLAGDIAPEHHPEDRHLLGSLLPHYPVIALYPL